MEALQRIIFVEADVYYAPKAQYEQIQSELVKALRRELHRANAFRYWERRTKDAVHKTVYLSVWDKEDSEFKQISVDIVEPNEYEMYGFAGAETSLIEHLMGAGYICTCKTWRESTQVFMHRAMLYVKPAMSEKEETTDGHHQDAPAAEVADRAAGRDGDDPRPGGQGEDAAGVPAQRDAEPAGDGE